MWCPNCNKEYDEGFTLCAKCGEKLVAYTPIVSDQDAEASIFDCDEPTEEEVTKEQETAESDMLFDAQPKLLITVIGQDEALRIMELLEANLIPSLKKNSQSQSEEPELDFESDEEPGEAEDFSAFCDEPLDGEEVFDIFVPEASFQDAFRIIVEDERGGGSESEPAPEKTQEKKPFSFFARFKRKEKEK